MQSYQVTINLNEGGTKPVVFVADNAEHAKLRASFVYFEEGEIGDAELMDEEKWTSFKNLKK
ncbi:MULTISPECIES: hypothetical protein [Pseudomonas]|jgi:hypothetical protein|uniref:hypothetical protein n=1 Tax=Pseudomonas TaxID=286 RepID=UPI000D037768|nr:MULTISPECIES: hypothetical protein [Pseudomonas]MBK3477673.1 hypothetical protein [Pseudomonas sp. MF6751]MBO0495752.1 hypothetical protein [Pseudomonas sp. Marseille-Q1929]MBW9247337.1 hypothetical protein [Pseudomonas paracarnis]